jgi:hypothetical protein
VQVPLYFVQGVGVAWYLEQTFLHGVQHLLPLRAVANVGQHGVALVEQNVPHLPENGVVVERLFERDAESVRHISYSHARVREERPQKRKQYAPLGRAAVCREYAHRISEVLERGNVANPAGGVKNQRKNSSNRRRVLSQ